MKIAPIDIAHKSFVRKFMGVDADEVAEFLKSVADEMEELIRERNSLREVLREKELQVAEYKERDGMLKSTLTTATQMSEKIRFDADREARLITDDARQKAELIVRDARDSLRKIYGEISELKKARVQFENNLRALAQAHLAMIEQGAKLMPDPMIEKPHELGARMASSVEPPVNTNL